MGRPFFTCVIHFGVFQLDVSLWTDVGEGVRYEALLRGTGGSFPQGPHAEGTITVGGIATSPGADPLDIARRLIKLAEIVEAGL